jgi:ribonuclease HII
VSAGLILGLDEAGRGPVLGPLVLAGVFVKRDRQRALLEIGVRDSKAFGSTAAGRKRRSQLAAQIHALAASTVVLSVDASEVDRRVRLGELDHLERELARAVLECGPEAARVFADGERLFGPLRDVHPRFVSLDRADVTCPAVAAASILAKVERDAQTERIVARLAEALGLEPEKVRGGGYANASTEALLRAYFARYHRIPDEVRRSYAWPVLRELDRLQAGLRPVSRAEQLSLLGADAPAAPEGGGRP